MTYHGKLSPAAMFKHFLGVCSKRKWVLKYGDLIRTRYGGSKCPLEVFTGKEDYIRAANSKGLPANDIVAAADFRITTRADLRALRRQMMKAFGLREKPARPKQG